MIETGTAAHEIRAEFKGGALSLFGRALVTALLSMLVIPAPWMMAWYWRWFIGSTSFSDGTGVSFHGEGEQIWWAVMGTYVIAILGYFIPFPLTYLTLFVTVYFSIAIVRWIVRNIRIGDETRMEFTGSYWGLLGWTVLVALSIFTIIGWAWVEAAMLRWYLRSVKTPSCRLAFSGSGWGILWRTVCAFIACVVIISIPWVMQWLIRWYVSNIVLSGAAPEDARVADAGAASGQAPEGGASG